MKDNEELTAEQTYGILRNSRECGTFCVCVSLAGGGQKSETWKLMRLVRVRNKVRKTLV